MAICSCLNRCTANQAQRRVCNGLHLQLHCNHMYNYSRLDRPLMKNWLNGRPALWWAPRAVFDSNHKWVLYRKIRFLTGLQISGFHRLTWGPVPDQIGWSNLIFRTKVVTYHSRITVFFLLQIILPFRRYYSFTFGKKKE